jgi:hypothetical protein
MLIVFFCVQSGRDVVDKAAVEWRVVVFVFVSVGYIPLQPNPCVRKRESASRPHQG